MMVDQVTDGGLGSTKGEESSLPIKVAATPNPRDAIHPDLFISSDLPPSGPTEIWNVSITNDNFNFPLVAGPGISSANVPLLYDVLAGGPSGSNHPGVLASLMSASGRCPLSHSAHTALSREGRVKDSPFPILCRLKISMICRDTGSMATLFDF
jgi:hypothetical protein